MDPRAVRGVSWTLLTYSINKGISLVTTMILARLLSPSDFGIVALAALVIGAIGVFNDLGLGGAMIVRQDLEERDKGTIQTMMLATATAAALLIVAMAPIAAALLDEPELELVLAVMAITLPLGSVGWFYETLMQRQLDFRRRFIAQGCQNCGYAVLALSLASLDAGVWSIVVAFVAGTGIYSGVLVALSPTRVKPRWDKAVGRDVFRTGRGFLAQGGLSFVKHNADYMAVGTVLGPAQLGYYAMSYRLCELPYLAIADPVARVTFPEFARTYHRGESVRETYLTVLRLIAVVTAPFGLLLSGAADPFVEAILGEKWTPMTGPLATLAIWAAVRPVETTIGSLLNSLGQAGLLGIITAGWLAPLIPGVILAAQYGGTTAVAWVMLADVVVSLVTLSYVVHRRLGVSINLQWSAIRPVALAAPLTWAASRVVAVATEDVAPGVALAASAAAGLCAYVALLAALDRRALTVALRQIGRTMGRGRSRSSPAGEEL